MFDYALIFLAIVVVAPVLVDLTIELVRYWEDKQ